MSQRSASDPSLRAGRRRAAVAIALLLAVLAHLLVIEWLKSELQLIAPDDEDDGPTVSVTLQQAEAPPAAAPVPPPPPPAQTKPAPPIDTAQPYAAVPLAEAPPSTAPAPAPVPEAAPAVEAAPAESTAVTSTAPVAEAPPEPPESSPAPAASAPPLFERALPPPPAELSYSVIAVRGGARTEGRGSMSWRHDGQRYTLVTEIGVLFFTLAKYRSEGTLGRLGIAPELYAEKRLGRSETNTHFRKAEQVISFSASTATVPAKGGEQDRGSWAWQLASLGRGDPGKFEAGLTLAMTVAGTKAADSWRLYVNGRENIVLADGSVSAWRISVIPGADSFEKQFDVWLAPERDWYPVRLTHVDRNGNSVELMLTKISARKEGP